MSNPEFDLRGADFTDLERRMNEHYQKNMDAVDNLFLYGTSTREPIGLLQSMTIVKGRKPGVTTAHLDWINPTRRFRHRTERVDIATAHRSFYHLDPLPFWGQPQEASPRVNVGTLGHVDWPHLPLRAILPTLNFTDPQTIHELARRGLRGDP